MSSEKKQKNRSSDVGFSVDQIAGLSKRELIAAMAMQAIVSGNSRDASISNSDPFRDVSWISIKMADVLIAELAKDGKP